MSDTPSTPVVVESSPASTDRMLRDTHSDVRRGRRTLQWPITLSVSLMVLNVALMVSWIVLLARTKEFSILAIGTVVFAVMLVGLSVYLVLTIKEVKLNQRQANFVDSVTHELKSPIAALQMYLQTLQMRPLEEDRRKDFYRTMEKEVRRLDELINHLLEVGRLEAIGQRDQPENVELEPMLRRCAEAACLHHDAEPDETVVFEVEPAMVTARRVVLEMIFRNLIDNAIKYSPKGERVEVVAHMLRRDRVAVDVRDRGEGVPADIRRQIFRIFYRGGKELERTQKGTGLGLYIVRTLVRLLKGRVDVHDRDDGPGSVFRVELPGRAVP